MKLLTLFWLKKMKRHKLTTSLQKSNRCSSDTQMTALFVKIPKMLPKKKRIKKRDCNLPKDHLLQRRRKWIWQQWMCLTWSKAWAHSKTWREQRRIQRKYSQRQEVLLENDLKVRHSNKSDICFTFVLDAIQK